MGSQTLEILRQGVWASLTGGWFYDPHQNVFCNAVHLYLWMFLLCSPFVTYLYFPKTAATWALYCLCTGVTVAVVKVANLALHLMYDEAQIVSEKQGGGNGAGGTANGSDGKPMLREFCDDAGSGGTGGGIEMQLMGGGSGSGAVAAGAGGDVGGLSVGGADCGAGAVSGGGSSMGLGQVSSTGIGGGGTSGDNQTGNSNNEISQANSVLSIEYAAEQAIGTIDLKVDVHRKNSSESSDLSLGALISAKALSSASVITHSADICQTANHRRSSIKTKSKSEEAHGSQQPQHRSPISEEDVGDLVAAAAAAASTPTVSAAADETSDRFVDIEAAAAIGDRQQKKKLRSKLQRQVSLDAEKMAIGLARSIDTFARLQRHRSTETPGEYHRRRLRQLDAAQGRFPATAEGQVIDGGGGGDGPSRALVPHQQSVPSDLYYIPDDVDEYEDDDEDDDDEEEDENDVRTADDDGDEADCDDDDTGHKHRQQQQQQHHHHHHHHHRHHHHQPKTPMRKDSNSTMSALQLPTSASSASAVGGSQRLRRHSNAIGGGGSGGGKGAPSSGSTTSMTLAATGSGSGNGGHHHQSTTGSGATVRRIKSAALETCCPQPSVSNLVPHPSSVETLGAPACAQLRNPQHAMLPPPSKGMVRTAHPQLVCGGGSDVAMHPPIAEAGAAKATSGAERRGRRGSTEEEEEEEDGSDEGSERAAGKRVKRLDSDAVDYGDDDEDDEDDEDDDDDDDGGACAARSCPRKSTANPSSSQREHHLHHHHHHHHHHIAPPSATGQSQPTQPASTSQHRNSTTTTTNTGTTTTTTSESDLDRPATPASVSDSEDTENNAGSQSPLLDLKSRGASYYSGSKSTGAIASVASAQPAESKASCSQSAEKLKSKSKSHRKSAAENDDDMAGAVGGVAAVVVEPVGEVGGDIAAVGAAGAAVPGLAKSEDSGCPSSDCDQASASSKDMLLTAASASVGRDNPPANERRWFDFRMDSNNISVDVMSPEASPAEPAREQRRSVASVSTSSVATNTPGPAELRLAEAAALSNARSQGAIPKRTGRSSSYANNSCSSSAIPSNQLLSPNPPPPPAPTVTRFYDYAHDAHQLPPLNPADNYPLSWNCDPGMFSHLGGINRPPGSRGSSWSSSSRRCSADSSAAIMAAAAAVADQQAREQSPTPPPPLYLDHIGRQPSVEVMHRTKEGWTLRNSACSSPAAAMARGEPPPLIPIYNTRRPYVSFTSAPTVQSPPMDDGQPSSSAAAGGGGHGQRPQHRPYQTKLRLSARHRSHHHMHSHGGGSGGSGVAGGVGGVAAGGSFDSVMGAGALAPVNSAGGGSQPLVVRPRYAQEPLATWDYRLTTTGGLSCGTLQLELHAPPEMGARERSELQGRIDANRTGISASIETGILPSGGVGSMLVSGGRGGGGLGNLGGPGGASAAGGLSVTGVSSVGADSSVPISLGVDYGEAVFCDYWRHYDEQAAKRLAEKRQPRRVYTFPVRWWGKRRDIKVAMDRLQLLALLDRDLGWFQALLGILLAAAVSALGAAILRLGVYRDLFAFVFCFVMAGSQYSLLKSVQPDAASPIHGFNKAVAFSRPIYFCMLAALLIGLHGLRVEAEAAAQPLAFTLFTVHVCVGEVWAVGESLMAFLLLLLPVFFSLGLFPQINTFLVYLLEQVDMHVFGGSAVCSLLSAFLGIVRSVLACTVLYGPAYGGLAETRGTQHVLYSAFCAMLIAIGYHLSRSASDVSCLWALIKRSLVLHTDDDDEEEEEEEPKAEETVDDEDRRSRQSSSLNAVTSASAQNVGVIPSKSASVAAAEESDEEARSLNRPNRKRSDDEDDEAEVVRPETTAAAEKADGHSASASQRDITIVNVPATPPQGLVISMPASPESAKLSDSGDVVVRRRKSSKSANQAASKDADLDDPLPRKLQQTVNARLKNDALVCFVIAGLVFCLHCSTVFTVLQPELARLLVGIVSVLGALLHYVVPQMRKHLPWLWFAGPMLRQAEHDVYEPKGPTQVMWFERAYVYACFVERNVLYPLLFVAALTADGATMVAKWGVPVAALIVVVCGLKGIRGAYSDPSSQYLIFIFAWLLFAFDFKMASETLLIDYFVMAIIYRKSCEFTLKLQFILTYIAPWQITWGSAFHAFAQPFSVPHSAMLFVQAAISAIFSTPLNPFLGSAIFLTSYVRPIKFWERDYNTKRIDHSNTRLSSQLERDLGADDNNLNSIFYEHLTRSLQHSLCGDLQLGRWGNVSQGDCFVLASDYLNCLVHIIELGNGLCTFQMRGLEFRGTYCQQREVEAISEGVQENEGCCCCAPGHLPRMLSVNAMFSTRWLAWQVIASKYVLEGYSISDNLAQATLQVFEFRKVLITYYVKSIIYYTVRSPKLEEWLQSPAIQDALRVTLERSFVDLDPIFNHNLDDDFDFRSSGITRHSFCSVYMGWIKFCYAKRFAPKAASTPIIVEPPSASTTSRSSGPSATPPTTSAASAAMSATPTTSGSSALAAVLAAANSSSAPISSTSAATNTDSNNDLSRSGAAGGVAAAAATASSDAAATLQPPPPHRLTRSSPRAHKRRSRSEKSSSSASASSAKRQHRHTLSQVSQGSQTRLTGGEEQLTPPPQVSTDGSASGTSAASMITRDSPLVSLLLCLGLLGRRTLATASHNNSLVTVVELFLHGLHALFKGDFRITSQRDEWVFADMDLLHSVVAPAVKMALKLHQDHFLSPEEFEEPAALYAAIETHTSELVISHEADPLWRNAVLRGAPNLLALRHVMEDGSDEYRLIRLTKRFLGFRVIKVNRECVRGLWAGQQQELIYLRNRNPERGSIQNAKQALRNIINSSCDQPIGYPIYVSPLTTSYAETNQQLSAVIGGAITLEKIHHYVRQFCQRVRKRCREGCSSGSVTLDAEMGGGGGGSRDVGTMSGQSAAGGQSLSGRSGAGDVSAAGAGAAGSNLDMQGAGAGVNTSSSLSVGGGAGAAASALNAGAGCAYGIPGLAAQQPLAFGGQGLRGSSMSVGKPTSNAALLAGLLSRGEPSTALTTGSPTRATPSLSMTMAAASGLAGPATSASYVSEVGQQKRRLASRRVRRATLPISHCANRPEDEDSVAAAAAACEQQYQTPAAAAAAAASSSLHQHAMLLQPAASNSAAWHQLQQTPTQRLREMRRSIAEERGPGPGPPIGGYLQQLQSQYAIELRQPPRRGVGVLRPPRIPMHRKVIIVDRQEIFECLDLGRRVDGRSLLLGPTSKWQDWQPQEGMVGYVVHYWQPNHPDAAFRSNFDRTLLLVQVGERFVPVGEQGVKEYNTTGSLCPARVPSYATFSGVVMGEHGAEYLAMPVRLPPGAEARFGGGGGGAGGGGDVVTEEEDGGGDELEETEETSLTATEVEEVSPEADEAVVEPAAEATTAEAVSEEKIGAGEVKSDNDVDVKEVGAPAVAAAAVASKETEEEEATGEEQKLVAAKRKDRADDGDKADSETGDRFVLASDD